MKKMITAAAAGLAVLAAPLAASAAPWHEHGGYGWRGHSDNVGPAIAAGIFGLAIGAALASSNHHPYYGYADHPYYGYGERCGWRTERYVDGWGDVHVRRVE